MGATEISAYSGKGTRCHSAALFGYCNVSLFQEPLSASTHGFLKWLLEHWIRTLTNKLHHCDSLEEAHW
jgi:hypothetical protein